jgi:hypothetical protein
MQPIRIAVFEDAKMSRFDIVCPNCLHTIEDGYKGQRGRLSKKCSSCNLRWYEYSAIAVEPGKKEEISKGDIQQTLKSFWDSQFTLGRGSKRDYQTEAEKLNITWNP